MFAFAATIVAAMMASAQTAPSMKSFTTGPVFDEFGPVADIETSAALPANLVLRHAFDVAEPGEAGKPSRGVETAARFINMHVRAGLARDHVKVAVVVHGRAVGELTKDAREAPTGRLVAALLTEGHRVIVCGQSAAAYGVEAEDLAPGVEMAISAMTAHARLQQSGYTVNPF